MQLKVTCRQFTALINEPDSVKKLNFIEQRVKTWVSEVIEGNDGLTVQANLLSKRVDGLIEGTNMDAEWILLIHLMAMREAIKKPFLSYIMSIVEISEEFTRIRGEMHISDAVKDVLIRSVWELDPPERETVFLSASARVVECNFFSETPARVVQGHGIASGKNYDARFPQGTLAMQIPIFEKLGLNFSDFYQGTINLDVSPSAFKLGKPAFCFTKVDWSKDEANKYNP